MPYITANDGTQILVYFTLKDALLQKPSREDIQQERNLIGTERTMVNRLGFGSREFEQEIWTSSNEMTKLDTARANTVTYDGVTYSLSFTSPVSSYVHQDIETTTIRLKQV